MRVIEPKHRQKKASRDIHSREQGHTFAIAAILIIMSVIGYAIYSSNKLVPQTATPAPSTQEVKTSEPIKKGTLRVLTGQQFRDLYERFAYPNTQRIDENTAITGNLAADERIKSIAQSRGYVIRSAPVSDVFKEVDKGVSLQERASQPWLDLRDKARQSGQIMKLTAGYRSADDQRDIFLSRLGAQAVPIAGIAAGSYDVQINKVLSTTAPPGYSRHHSGYTIDITCENDPYVTFEKSLCFGWLSADNYRNAKTFGWIPSYPIGTDKQGPEPEAWEYVWVGIESLTE